MLNRLAIALAALALAGCPGKKSATPETTPDPTTETPPPETTPEPEESAGAPSCLDVAVHVAETIQAEGDPARFQDAVTTVCTDGGWSEEARRCMGNASNEGALEECAKTHLSPEEYDRAGEALEAAMEGS